MDISGTEKTLGPQGLLDLIKWKYVFVIQICTKIGKKILNNTLMFHQSSLYYELYKLLMK